MGSLGNSHDLMVLVRRMVLSTRFSARQFDRAPVTESASNSNTPFGWIIQSMTLCLAIYVDRCKHPGGFGKDVRALAFLPCCSFSLPLPDAITSPFFWVSVALRFLFAGSPVPLPDAFCTLWAIHSVSALLIVGCGATTRSAMLDVSTTSHDALSTFHSGRLASRNTSSQMCGSAAFNSGRLMDRSDVVGTCDFVESSRNLTLSCFRRTKCPSPNLAMAFALVVSILLMKKGALFQLEFLQEDLVFPHCEQACLITQWQLSWPCALLL